MLFFNTLGLQSTLLHTASNGNSMQACHQVGQAGAGAGAVWEGAGEWTREGIGDGGGIGAGGTQGLAHLCSIPHRTE